MFRVQKRWFYFLLTIAMLVAFCVPVRGPALAAISGYEALQIPDVNTDDVDSLGTVLCHVRAGALKEGDSISLRLPADFQFLVGAGERDDVMGVEHWEAVASESKAIQPNFIEVPERYAGDNNIVAPGDLVIEMIGHNEIKVLLQKISFPDRDEAYFKLHMGRVYIPCAAAGDIEVVAAGPSGTGFPQGRVVAGRVVEGDVKLTVLDSPTFDDYADKASDPITIRFEEELKGALEQSAKSLKLVLPNGFEWQDVESDDFTLIWGGWGDRERPGCPKISTAKGDSKGNDLIIYNNKDELVFEVINESVEAACFELALGIRTADETKAQKGELIARVCGDSSANRSEVTVGTYGECAVEVKVDSDLPTLFAGQVEQGIADIKITEAVPGSLIPGRTLTFRLPSNAKWGDIVSSDSDNGLALEFVNFVGDDGREIKYQVQGSSADTVELSLEKMEVLLEPGVDGDLKIEIGGTQDVNTGELVVAKVIKPVEIKAAGMTDIEVGRKGQTVGELVITENKAGAIKNDKDLVIELSAGVKYKGTPAAKVTKGDLDIDEEEIEKKRGRFLYIPVKAESTEPSTIEIPKLAYDVNKMTPDGNVQVKVNGPAINQVNDKQEIKDTFQTDGNWVIVANKKAFKMKDKGMIWPQSQDADEIINAKVVTVAPGEITGLAVFTIGEKKYTADGAEEEIDVAPVVNAGRTYLPARYVANAVGVPDSQISWNQDTQTVTIFKGKRIIQMTVGSNDIMVNNVPVKMDAIPKVVSGRVLIPLRFLAQALGAEVDWDQAAPETIILNF